MDTENDSFSAEIQTMSEQVAKSKPFAVRAVLRRALVAYLAPLLATHFDGDESATALLAQQLALVPSIRKNWGPSQREVTAAAKRLVDSYLARRFAFAREEFPAPAQAALESLKDLQLEV